MVFSVLGLRRGLAFRRGTDRGMLDRYRDVTQPALQRNMPLVLPIVSAWVLALLLGGALVALVGISTLEKGVAVVVALGGLLALFMLLPVMAALSYWTPKWIIPKWLTEDDKAVGFVPPKPGWGDRIWLVIGLVGLGVLLWLMKVVIELAISRGVV